MKHIIIGTAGHIDHGKTCLIRALTGMDTDRLAEEKRRGITIDLGFAHMALPNGVQAGIIDVPGHERFIKNMLAGAGCIDLVLMVVAADEGVMPQTAEHLEILSLLGIKRGIVVITKTDLVDAEGLTLAKQDIAERFANSFLADAPVYAVSYKTGVGIDALCTAIATISASIPYQNDAQPFRLPIDRVFTVDGFGTVVTGVVAEGSVTVGDSISIYPSGEAAKIRGLQSYGKNVEKVAAGQRAAVNLTGINKQKLKRGDVLAYSGSLSATYYLDVKLIGLPNIEKPIVNNQRVHLFIGTSAVLCRIVLFGTNELQAGKSAYAQLRLESPVAVRNGDRFVVRFYSPLCTIGGGTVLNANPVRHKRSDITVLNAIRIADTGTLREQILQLMRTSSVLYMQEQIHSKMPKIPKERLQEELQALIDKGDVIKTDSQLFVLLEYLQLIAQKAQTLLSDYHNRNPLEEGMPKQEFKVALFGQNPAPAADEILHLLNKRGVISVLSHMVALPTFCCERTSLYVTLKEKVMFFYNKQGFVPAPPESIASDDRTLLRVALLLMHSGALIKLPSGCCIGAEYYNSAVQKLKQYLLKNSNITLAQYRDLLGISRKPAQQLLEYFDAVGITNKTGDVRTLK